MSSPALCSSFVPRLLGLAYGVLYNHSLKISSVLLKSDHSSCHCVQLHLAYGPAQSQSTCPHVIEPLPL